MREMTLVLTVDETNLILEGLGNLPFARVYALVAKIQEQAGRQLERGGTAGKSPSGDSGDERAGGTRHDG